MVERKRIVAKKPAPTPPPEAASWVSSGGIDPELQPTAPAATSTPSTRAQGKRSRSDYKQVGAYIPKDLDKQVKRLLLDNDEMDFSDLVTQLLEDWVNQQSD
ncbi:hypothetical protein ACQ4M4_27375 [Leptolyngbya sp. AN02str]|uniref:hypothetical protein n=1 Tax=Leptolyngbya sp. AN02str TaxID=3423363 RepID=UPI003D317F7A